MIGKNIKSLRKTHDLTQDDFSRIVGISRNSLSRYENGTSSVSTELIDIICQKFNVSYVDIVGEDKMLLKAIFNQSTEDYLLEKEAVALASNCQELENQLVISPDGFVIF
ncbi:transcriptional regulator [Streptococcus pneumoniae]|nr:transcriptional regulator [Streptococcus pneumoniae]